MLFCYSFSLHSCKIKILSLSLLGATVLLYFKQKKTHDTNNHVYVLIGEMLQTQIHGQVMGFWAPYEATVGGKLTKRTKNTAIVFVFKHSMLPFLFSVDSYSLRIVFAKSIFARKMFLYTSITRHFVLLCIANNYHFYGSARTFWFSYRTAGTFFLDPCLCSKMILTRMCRFRMAIYFWEKSWLRIFWGKTVPSSDLSFCLAL